MKPKTRKTTAKASQLSAADRKWNAAIDRDIRRCNQQMADIDKGLANKANW